MFQNSMTTKKNLIIFILLFAIANSYDDKYVEWCTKLKIYYNDLDCEHILDDFLDIPKIIARCGYPSETHVIITKDGYILELHRIPAAKNRTKGFQPVLLKHGLFGSSADWIINGENSLGFVLADQGYDVWLGNDRGNTYSTGHEFLSTRSDKYWNFSWHEMGVYDLPAIIKYISDVTGKPGELLYIGHSMGTTQFFVFSSLFPDLAKNVKLMIGLAPAAYETHLTSPIRYFSYFHKEIEFVGKTKFNGIMLCQNFVRIISGSELKETNLAIISTILSHDPAGSSLKNVIHYLQEMRNEGNFQHYDYGTKENLIKYGTATPPLYPLQNITVPVYFIYAKNDQMVSATDVYRLSQIVKNLVGLFEVQSDTFSHLDFVFGINVYKLVTIPILEVLKNYTISSS